MKPSPQFQPKTLLEENKENTRYIIIFAQFGTVC